MERVTNSHRMHANKTEVRLSFLLDIRQRVYIEVYIKTKEMTSNEIKQNNIMHFCSIPLCRHLIAIVSIISMMKLSEYV